MDYDKPKLHETYAEGRQQSSETISLWMDAVTEFLAPYERPRRSAAEQLTILDLGCGTGRFTLALAERFAAKIIGVEPSGKMRRRAEENASHPQVTYIVGCAEAIPYDDRVFDAALLSMVVHHFESIPDACRELWRVLRLGGYVFLRNCFRGRLNGIPTYEFWPTARAVDEERLPDMDELTDCFTSAGFERIAHRVVMQQTDDSLKAHYERLKLGAVSTFELISNQELQEGFESLARAAGAETTPRPVTEPIDFLVFRKSDKRTSDS